MTYQSNPTRLDAIESIGASKAWQLWLVVCTVTLAASLTTIRLSPVAWQDEVQILDYGRTLLPGSDLSIGLSLDSSGIAIRPVSYLGCLASELAFRICGGDMIGPRLVAILGAIGAATAMFGYLRARTRSTWIPLLLASALLLDPVFAQGYRGARCDSWVMAFMLAGCWALRVRDDDHRRSWAREAACGVMVALAAATWVSALLLLPLVVLEIYEASRRGPCQSLRTALFAELRVAGWTVLALMLLLLPYWQILPEMIGATASYSGQMMATDRPLSEVLSALASPFKASPLLPVAGVASVIVARQWKLAAAALIALALVCKSGPYSHRNVYLEPYFIIAVAVGLQLARASVQPKAMRVAFTVAIVIVSWAALTTLGARNASAIRDRVNRDPGAQLASLKTCLGDMPRTAYVGAWRAYYAVRELGWRYVRPFSPSPEAVNRVLAGCDVVLVDPTAKEEPATPALIAAAGFREVPCNSVAQVQTLKIYVRSGGDQAPTKEAISPSGIAPK